MELYADLARLDGSDGPVWSAETDDLDSTMVSWDAGGGVVLHTNHEVDVVMVVLAGEGEVQRGLEVFPVRAGSVIVIPKGTERRVTATTRITYLNVHRRRQRLRPLAKPPWKS